ncbi:MAG: SdpI family protein [Clostridia bacterium]|nr:SdpI family protein [Clostridia bacterium]
MIKQNKKTLVITSLLILVPIIFGLLVWSDLPEKIPIHWGLDGTPDRYGSKGFAVFGFPLVVLALQWLCAVITEKDPKNKNQSKKALGLMLWIFPAVSLAVSALMYSYTLGSEPDIKAVMCVLLGIIYVAIGNYLPKCRQSHTVGIKIKWTLSDEENWNATHRFGGKIAVVCGVLVILCAFLPNTAAFAALICLALVMVAVPTVYSYRLFKKKNGK